MDVHALLEKLHLPGIDARKLVEARKKDVEALLAANERAFAGAEALAKKQAEMLGAIMMEWEAASRDAASRTPATEKISVAAQHAQQAFTHALSNMKELADIASQSNHEVLDILNRRFREALHEFRISIRPGGVAKER